MFLQSEHGVVTEMVHLKCRLLFQLEINLMKLNLMKTVWLAITLASCAHVKQAAPNDILQIKGHLTLSAGGSCLITEDLQHSYDVQESDFPQFVWNYLKNQKPHVDIRSMNNQSVSCEIIAQGKLGVVANKYARFSANKILYIGKAQKSFENLWGKEPIPRPNPL